MHWRFYIPVRARGIHSSLFVTRGSEVKVWWVHQAAHHGTLVYHGAHINQAAFNTWCYTTVVHEGPYHYLQKKRSEHVS